MTRPALVIGLGGTGQTVLTYLKRELLEMGGGEMPANVKLLAFDTASYNPIFWKDERNSDSSKSQEEEARIGNVVLDQDTEFISIGDNLYPLAQQIKNGMHEHLQWFPAEAFDRHNLPQASYVTTQGAGAIRQMGRLSLFQNVTKVTDHIRQAINQLQNHISYDRNANDYHLLEILVVGSLAGGTGAGTLIDIAWLVRKEAEALSHVQGKYLLRGFFVLPTAFISGGANPSQADRDKMTRSFAAWVELDRFMLSKVKGCNEVVYNNNLRISCDKPVYDVTYILDAQRPDRPLLPPPTDGLFPNIAQCMSFIIDERAGVKYSEQAINVISETRFTLPVGVYHSSIGSYTVKVPVYYAQQKFSHKLALEVLDIFLAPQKNDKNRVIGVSENANAQAYQGSTGLKSVLDFLSSSAQNLGDTTVPNTPFFRLVADVRREIESQKSGDLVLRVSQGNISQEKNRFLVAMTDIGQDEKGKQISNQILSELRLNIYDIPSLQPSRKAGDSPEQAWTRIVANVEAERTRHWGADAVKGQRLRGQYGAALEKAKEAQVARFKLLLQAWTFNALNGTPGVEPRLRVGGKIGYVNAFYRELVDTLDKYLGFLDEVRSMRNENIKPYEKAKASAMSAQNRYKRDMDKHCWLTFWDGMVHPDAHIAQREYLLAEQRVVNVRKDDILLDFIVETAVDLKNYAENSLEEINLWIGNLATGVQKNPSLYFLASKSFEAIEVNHHKDINLGNPNFESRRAFAKVLQVIGQHEYRTEDRFVDQSLDHLVWNAGPGPDGLRLECGMNMPDGEPRDDGTIPTKYVAFQRVATNNPDASRNNFRQLLLLVGQNYNAIAQDYPLANEITNYFPDGSSLADGIKGWAEPFYARTPGGGAGAAHLSGYLRTHYSLNSQSADYFNQFINRHNAHTPGVNMELVESEDMHKLTMLRADDLMPSEDFYQWHNCQEQYLKQITDGGTSVDELYVFQAERNAAYYENLVPTYIKKNYFKMHPEVVGLLEQRERFVLFFLASAHGFIKSEKDEDGFNFWFYRINEDDEPLYLTLPNRMLVQDEKISEKSVFALIRNFINGSDQRREYNHIRRINWDALRKAVLSSENRMGMDAACEHYQKIINESSGITREINLEKEQIVPSGETDGVLIGMVNTQNFNLNQLRKMELKRYDDLRDIGRVVYVEAQKRINRNWKPAK